MNKINWCGYEWLTQERWGEYHPNKAIVWYDPSQIVIYKNLLKLGCAYNPKVFTTVNEKSSEMKDIVIPFGVGLISCTNKFGYGTFELEAKLPNKQPNAWPAFWMYAFESWPPEIDVVEGYANKNGSYFNWNIDCLLGNFWKCETNVHLGKVQNPKSIGAKKHWMGWKNPSKTFVKYKVEWFEDKIEIYYNGKSVRKITDENVLSEFRGKTMNVVINNSITSTYDEKKQYFFEIKNFIYTKK